MSDGPQINADDALLSLAASCVQLAEMTGDARIGRIADTAVSEITKETGVRELLKRLAASQPQDQDSRQAQAERARAERQKQWQESLAKRQQLNNETSEAISRWLISNLEKNSGG